MSSDPATKRAAQPQNPQPPYSFHGSNSSHSHDNGTGGRTYHIPNYATSYANDRTSLISVTFDEDRGSQRITIIFIVAILLITAVPAWIGLPSVVQSYGSSRAAETHGSEADGSVNLDTPLDAGTVEIQQDKSPWNVTWSKPVANQICHGFGTREFSATLVNLPFFASWEEACRSMPVIIGGATYNRPSLCEKSWLFGQVKGHWIVKSGDEVCLPNWGPLKDKGCVAPGSRRRGFEARLLRLKDGENRMALCWTTPILIYGRPMSKPGSCHEGVWGVYGFWDVEDIAC